MATHRVSGWGRFKPTSEVSDLGWGHFCQVTLGLPSDGHEFLVAVVTLQAVRLVRLEAS
jgi:hypothetical protein